MLRPMYHENKIELFVIDEIHCIKSWGEDFRFEYLQLYKLKTLFGTIPLLGLTATANLKYRKDIETHLRRQFIVYESSFNRQNLIYIHIDKTEL
jgi:superfamily II DNA helicase RecQ